MAEEVVEKEFDCKTSAILVTGGYDHTIKLWQAHTGVCFWTAQHPGCQVNALAVSPDRHRVAAAGYQHLRFYDLGAAVTNPCISYEGVSKNVTRVGFQEEGKWFYTTGEDGCAKIWDLRSRSIHCRRMFKTGGQALTAAALHPNQTQLIVGDDLARIYAWNLRADNNCKIHLEEGPHHLGYVSVQSIAIDPAGKLCACVNASGICYLYDLCGSVPTFVRKFQAHQKSALKVAFSPNGKYLVTTSADKSARIWDTSDYSLTRELKCVTQNWVWDASFTADSRFLITGSSDGVARLWDLENGNAAREFVGHQKSIIAIAFSDEVANGAESGTSIEQ